MCFFAATFSEREKSGQQKQELPIHLGDNKEMLLSSIWANYYDSKTWIKGILVKEMLLSILMLKKIC